jgi:hypothetical protein
MPVTVERDLNGETLRIELSEELMFSIGTGRSYTANAVRILRAEETASGRTKWIDALAEGKKGVRRAPIVATGDKKPGECSYSELLAAVARIIEVSGES